MPSAAGNDDSHGGAPAGLAVQLDSTPQPVDDGTANGQPQPGPTAVPSPRWINSVKALEDVREVLRGDPDPRIGDGHQPVVRAGRAEDRYPPWRLGVLEGVVEQVIQDPA